MSTMAAAHNTNIQRKYFLGNRCKQVDFQCILPHSMDLVETHLNFIWNYGFLLAKETRFSHAFPPLATFYTLLNFLWESVGLQHVYKQPRVGMVKHKFHSTAAILIRNTKRRENDSKLYLWFYRERKLKSMENWKLSIIIVFESSECFSIGISWAWAKWISRVSWCTQRSHSIKSIHSLTLARYLRNSANWTSEKLLMMPLHISSIYLLDDR